MALCGIIESMLPRTETNLIVLGMALVEQAKGEDMTLWFIAFSELWLRDLERAEMHLEPAVSADLQNEDISCAGR